MAFNRCFNTYNNSIQTSSDYMASVRQNTIYTNIASNTALTGSGNPTKTNGYKYNKNFGVVPLASSNNAGCLVNANSYDLLLDVTKGMMIHNTELGYNTNVLNNNDAWNGNFFSIEYVDKGVDVVVDTSYNAGNANQIIFPQTISAHAADLSFNNAYPGVIVDPCYNIFYNPCLLSYNDGKNPWIRLVNNTKFQDTNSYKQAINSDPLYQMSYPQKVIFVCDGLEYWTITGTMSISRASHTATLIPNGNVLVAGGIYSSSDITNTSELYDSTTGLWSDTRIMNTGRAYHTENYLNNGTVLVTGGGTLLGITDTCELYDINTNSWNYTGNLNTSRIYHTSTIIFDSPSPEKVLVTGGEDNLKNIINTSELYDPNTGLWNYTSGNMNTGRAYHTATPTEDNKVLVTGGGTALGITNTCELYDQISGLWSNADSMDIPRAYHTATLLGDKVLVTGGLVSSSSTIITDTCELYDINTNSWTNTGSMNIPRAFHTANILQNGKVLVAGGGNSSGITDTSELYDPTTGTWTTTYIMNYPRAYHTGTLLLNDNILVTGGGINVYNNTITDTTEFYKPK